MRGKSISKRLFKGNMQFFCRAASCFFPKRLFNTAYKLKSNFWLFKYEKWSQLFNLLGNVRNNIIIVSHIDYDHQKELTEGLYNVVNFRHPTLKWAQRSDVIFMTIELPDAKDVKLKLEPEGKFFFSATSGPENIPYEIDIDLYDKVDVNESKSSIGLRNIVYLIKKAEPKWWTRLIKQEGKPPLFLKVDWDKWVDEDEQDEKVGADMDFGDVDFSKLNMGGGGDFDDDADDKDEEDYDSDTEDEDKDKEEAAPATSSSEPAEAKKE